MRGSRWVRLGVMLACLVSCTGCGSQGGRQALSGSVTYQGQPLEQGTITFLTTAGAPGPACGALIRAGRFEVPAAQGLEPGAYRVVISAPVPGGKLTPEEVAAGASPRARESLPEKYNTASTLKADVTAGGPNQFDYALE